MTDARDMDTTATQVPQPTRDAHPTRRRAAVVVNAAKFRAQDDLDRFRALVDHNFDSHGWSAPVWLPTTAQTQGRLEAELAARADVDVVVAAGGDGTIRTVAQELMGTGVPLGLLPLGTGNLLARNLGVPRRDTSTAVALICAGRDRTIDVGWVELDRNGTGEACERYAFLVMAGAGFDALTMAGAGGELKRHLGPAAYVVSGIRALGADPVPITVLADGEAVMTASSAGFVVGNFGKLTMGLDLMPAADTTDGLIDGVFLLPQSTADWTQVAWAVAAGTTRPQALMPRFRGGTLEFRSQSPQPVEVDGDVIGNARVVRAWTESAALTVRAAAHPTHPGATTRMMRPEVGTLA